MALPRYAEKSMPALLSPARWRGYTRLGGVEAGGPTKRWLVLAAGLGTFISLALLFLHGLVIDGPDPMWGLTEQQGWREPTNENLTDLGEIAEGRYRLTIDNTELGQRDYFQQITTFANHVPNLHLRHNLIHSIHKRLPSTLLADFPAPPGPVPTFAASMVSYKTIHQTDKERDGGRASREWREMNEPDGWSYNFMDDAATHEWISDVWAGSPVEWAWQFMHRGVLRADFFRYLITLVQGGVYSDVDTKPLRRIEEWGTLNVETLNISATDGEDWQAKMSTHPAVVVAVDVDVHGYLHWEKSWPRPLGICQWTLSSAPYHPIMIDAARRVVNATRVVDHYEKWRLHEINREQLIKADGYEARVKDLESKKREDAMNVMEWTGPGLFTDSVMAYLLARYNVTWHRFRALNHPLRIGEVMILPITAFSPGGQPDFKAEGRNSSQANVLHNFRGGWKGGH